MKKVLIVTYYWPPAGGPGVQRWLKFAKYLRDFGIEPVLYVPENAHYPLKDVTLESEIPEGIQIIKTRIFEPYSLANLFSKQQTQKISSGIIPDEQKQGFLQKLMLFIRGNFFIPDARKFWIKPSVDFLKIFLKENAIDTIITTGPPHSMHLIGLGLKNQMNLTWIADFRDPWTQIGYHKKLKLLKRSQKTHKKLERAVLESADQIITTSFTTKEEFQRVTGKPVEVVTNGYDYEKIESQPLDRDFTISHIGSLLSGRNPKNLWSALKELVSEDPSFAGSFKLKLVGAVGEPVVDSIIKAGLEEYLVLKSYVSHSEALQIQRRSQVLLLIEIDSEETRGIIPGKLFEYMVSNRPVLAVGPEKADIQRILGETNTGSYFLYSQKEEIKTFIRKSFKEYSTGELESHPIGLQKYSRQNLTGRLAEVIKRQAR